MNMAPGNVFQTFIIKSVIASMNKMLKQHLLTMFYKYFRSENVLLLELVFIPIILKHF